ncbi:hypothetical protein PBCV1_a113L [Paramecium bursaria Chlorella virus 1]|uniref:Uncharacterized protein n=1 Tax=Paramecium bursaria Chlorella virus 1 TaxID=10506 RepID=Q84434_PBCV1|nr:hypothetical protein PBCV1_a113L [Paramecium bursaria Chlorella virus 1]AAC96481.1 hypothetical protein [Paramecium bursaria Chlorella virus 1]
MTVPTPATDVIWQNKFNNGVFVPILFENHINLPFVLATIHDNPVFNVWECRRLHTLDTSVKKLTTRGGGDNSNFGNFHHTPVVVDKIMHHTVFI